MMLSSSSSSSSSSATVLVEKATSELLIGPDWTMNMEICDSINSNHWDAKDIVKAVKKRLQHKNPTVQLLSLTLVETMVKNCGDYVHFQIVEKNILQEMIKIIKKKTEMRVRDKILTLIDSWQEAFGGPGGKYPQYYWAYEELRRSGVFFPQRSSDSAPIFTPPVAQSTLRHAQAGYGMPSNSSSRLDEAMAAETGNLNIDSMRNALDLLADMLQAVNPSDRSSVKDEIIVDLVNQCRSNQKKLMQLLTTTGDEELLSQGLELNDSLQNVLAKHDAIASGSALLIEATTFSSPSVANNGSSLKPAEVKQETTNAGPSPQRVTSFIKGHTAEEEDLEDDFAQLARRHSKTWSTASEDTCTGTGEIVASVSIPSNALALPDPPAPVRTTKEQDMIDLLSLTLSTTTLSPEAPHTPTTASVSPTIQGYPNASQGRHGNQGQVPFNGYVAPWAQTQPQSQTQSQFQSEPYPNPQQIQPQPYPNPQSQQIPPQPYPHANTQLQIYPQPQPQQPQFSSGYPPPPWAPTPGYFSNQNHSPPPPYMSSTQQANPPPTHTAVQGARPSHQIYSVPARGINGSPMNGESVRNYSSPRGQTVAESKPFVPSYRLFEDLNVLGNGDGRFKTVSGTSSSLSGSSNPSMVGGRK